VPDTAPQADPGYAAAARPVLDGLEYPFAEPELVHLPLLVDDLLHRADRVRHGGRHGLRQPHARAQAARLAGDEQDCQRLRYFACESSVMACRLPVGSGRPARGAAAV
jgi:hypothetical protein